MTVSPLRRFILAALLWLPFAFFVWFAFAPQFVWPVVQIAKLVLLHGWPRLFLDVLQGADEIGSDGHLLAHHGFWMQVNTNVLYNAAPAGVGARLAYFDFPINPMIYGYCVPLFAGLVMATPLARHWRAVQIAAGLLILWLVQSFGVVSEAFKSVGIDLKEGAQTMAQLGYSLDLIALCYQFGYLILPPLIPAVLWILFNRAFIEEITRFGRPLPVPEVSAAEPNRIRRVETQQPGD
ncbi:MAG: exosortase H-associated membrane protein [Rudaea sp.]